MNYTLLIYENAAGFDLRNTPDAAARQAYWGGFMAYTKALQDAGVPLLAGTDTHAIGLVPGFSLHRELQSMKAAGLTSFEVLRAATRNAGEFLGGGFGVVAAGKRADLLLLEGNPLDDLENLNRRVGVMARGQWFAAEKAKQMMDGLATEYRGATENGAKRLSPDAGS